MAIRLTRVTAHTLGSKLARSATITNSRQLRFGAKTRLGRMALTCDLKSLSRGDFETKDVDVALVEFSSEIIQFSITFVFVDVGIPRLNTLRFPRRCTQSQGLAGRRPFDFPLSSLPPPGGFVSFFTVRGASTGSSKFRFSLLRTELRSLAIRS